MIAVGGDQFLLERPASRMLKRGSSINKPSIEERPAGLRRSCNMILYRDLDRSACKCHHVNPRQGIAVALKLLLDDSASGFLYD